MALQVLYQAQTVGRMTFSDSASQGNPLLNQATSLFSPRVLLVEDSPIDVRLVQLMLRKAEFLLSGVDLVAVGTLAEALVCIRQQRFDVTLLDLSLPDSVGLGTLRQLQAAQPTIPVVVLTATGDEQAGVDALRLGAQDYLIKGEISPTLLVRSMRYAIERKQAELRLADSQSFLMDVLNLSPDAIAVLQVMRDDRDRVVNFQWRLVNPAAERATGCSAAVLAQRSLLAHGTDPGARAAVPFSAEPVVMGESEVEQAARASQELFTWLLPVVTEEANQSREVFDRRLNSWFRVDACKLGDGVRLMCRNITQYKAIERMKDEFVSIVSHELRTPFSSLQGAIKLLATGRCDLQSMQGQQLIAVALRSAERLGQAIDVVLRLADLASTESLAKQRCWVQDLANRAYDRVVNRLQAQNLSITYSIPSDLTVWADPDAILDLFDRILDNAIKFSSPGSVLGFAVTLSPQDVIFHITDHGCGIPPTDLEQIFEPFYQVDSSDSRSRGGLGVSLTLCRRIVEQHGGQIWVTSELGKGSTFHISLPQNWSELPESQNPEANHLAPGSLDCTSLDRSNNIEGIIQTTYTISQEPRLSSS